jgi:2-polyprenyl-3-methyl-5-hydroxy-6-metoxy-1,4-benzoquinol methylase
MNVWENAQKHEADYWGNCLGMTAWGEFCKQEMYGREMGVFAEYGDGHGELSMRKRSVLDVGGGPVSMTLRCIDAGPLVVVDRCEWPSSVRRRYRNYGITFVRAPGEDLGLHDLPILHYDEVWLYNVLQHVADPAKVVTNAVARLSTVGRLRIFEWINIPADDCHPHVLTPDGILNWLHGCRIENVGLPHLKEFWSDAVAFTGIFSKSL